MRSARATAARPGERSILERAGHSLRERRERAAPASSAAAATCLSTTEPSATPRRRSPTRCRRLLRSAGRPRAALLLWRHCDCADQAARASPRAFGFAQDRERAAFQKLVELRNGDSGRRVTVDGGRGTRGQHKNGSWLGSRTPTQTAGDLSHVHPFPKCACAARRCSQLWVGAWRQRCRCGSRWSRRRKRSRQSKPRLRGRERDARRHVWDRV
jgi:hypothetical protein